MTNLIIYGYYYRYKQFRKNISDLVQINDFNQTRTSLDSVILEHDSYISKTPNSEFTVEENRSLHHASRHLEHAHLEVNQKQATIDALNE